MPTRSGTSLPPPGFIDHVRDALIHLSDLAHLQVHPLAEFVARDPASAAIRGRLLRRELLDAIEALRPEPGTSTQSRAWSIYQLLEARYIERLEVGEALEQLGLSKSEYHRRHAPALEAIASLLWEKWQGASWGLQGHRPRQPPTPDREELTRREIQQLKEEAAVISLDLAEALDRVVAILGPLSAQKRAPIRLRLPDVRVFVRASGVMLRQALVSILTEALDVAPAGQVDVSVAECSDEVEVHVVATPGQPDASLRPRLASPGTEISREFVAALGGRLLVDGTADGAWWVRMVLPVGRRPLVLVVDNNEDFVALVTRYLRPEGWDGAGALDAEQALASARELRPDVILMDVLMPGSDGWDLLTRLKADPQTAAIPVIVCSVLDQPQLASTLGAAGYIAKPVTRLSLLQGLRSQRPAAISDRQSATDIPVADQAYRG